MEFIHTIPRFGLLDEVLDGSFRTYCYKYTKRKTNTPVAEADGSICWDKILPNLTSLIQ
jgi:hypothetical protein